MDDRLQQSLVTQHDSGLPTVAGPTAFTYPIVDIACLYVFGGSTDELDGFRPLEIVLDVVVFAIEFIGKVVQVLADEVARLGAHVVAVEVPVKVSLPLSLDLGEETAFDLL